VAATRIQARIRGYLTVGRKESPEAMVPVLKDSTGKKAKSLGLYKIPTSGSRKYAYAAVPPKNPSFLTAPKGTNKYLSHIGDDLVGLTYHPPKRNGNKVDDPSIPDKDFDTLDGEILQFIEKNKLDYIVPQFRINKTQFLSRNMGAQDLYKQATSRQYQFSCAHFAGVASNLDTLHAAKIIHRDIKPANMALHQGHVHLLDLDTMAHSDKPQGHKARLRNGTNVTTTAYIHRALSHGVYNLHNGLPYGKMVDQYSFISSMISVFYQGRYPDTRELNSQEIDGFLPQLPCSPALKAEIRSFLLDPIRYPLPNHRRLAELLSQPI